MSGLRTTPFLLSTSLHSQEYFELDGVPIFGIRLANIGEMCPNVKKSLMQ